MYYNLRTICVGMIAIFLSIILLAGCSAGHQPDSDQVGTHLDETSETEIEDSQTTEPRRYNIEELAQQAIKSVAYIEVYNMGYPGYHSLGSGFVIDADGIIVTNYHVIEGATSARIEIGKQVFVDDKIMVLAAEEKWDLAILKVEAEGLEALPLGEGIDFVGLGEEVIALGNPEGMKGTVSNGIVSTVSRDIGLGVDLIQTTAPISKGSSGGPLLNMYGEVIGVTSLTLSSGQNLNFAIPSDLIRTIMDRTHQGVPITDFFTDRTYAAAGEQYIWQPGEFAVSLQWDEDVDLDLEIWNEEFQFVGAAASLGSSPDIFDGSMGEEWFVFKNQFARGRHVVSVYFYDAYELLPADATLTIHFPDGEMEKLQASLLSFYPYEQWFAILVDADEQSFKVLNFFFDAEVIAILEWDTEANLDLMVWDHLYDDIYTPADINGLDATDGRQAVEVFRFGYFQDIFGYDFSYGFMDILVGVEGTIDRPIDAEVKLVHADGLLRRFNHTFTPDARGEYLWHVLRDFNPSTLDYYMPPEPRFFLE